VLFDATSAHTPHTGQTASTRLLSFAAMPDSIRSFGGHRRNFAPGSHPPQPKPHPHDSHQSHGQPHFPPFAFGHSSTGPMTSGGLGRYSRLPSFSGKRPARAALRPMRAPTPSRRLLSIHRLRATDFLPAADQRKARVAIAKDQAKRGSREAFLQRHPGVAKIGVV